MADADAFRKTLAEYRAAKQLWLEHRRIPERIGYDKMREMETEAFAQARAVEVAAELGWAGD